MARKIQDADFQEWEVFASTGRGGYPRPSQIVFRNVSDRNARSRATGFDGDRSEAEKAVQEADDALLREWFDDSEVLDQDPSAVP